MNVTQSKVYTNRKRFISRLFIISIYVGDIIVRFGDYDIASSSDLTSDEKSFSAGDCASIDIYRGSDSLKVSVIFDEDGNGTGDTAGGDHSEGYSGLNG